MQLFSKLTLVLSFFQSLYASDDTDSRPNIVFIFSDDWGYNDVGWHGGSLIQTPYLDSLAADGLVLEQHYVQPTCTPSRAALMTGRYPSRLGLQHSTPEPGDPWGLPLDEVTIAQELQVAGYSTHIVGKWHLGFCAWEYTPTYRGFDTFTGYFLGAEDYWGQNRTVFADGIEYDGIDFRRNTDPLTPDGRYGPRWQVDEFVRTVNHDVTADQPFFIYLALQASHSPNQAPDDYVSKYDGIATGGRKLFSAQTTYLDDVMPEIINELKDNGYWDNTLIVFSSDNGARVNTGDNAPLRGAKNTLWEGGVRVPAFVTGGALKEELKGTITGELIHVTDWYPTFLSVAGITDPMFTKDLDGIDATPVLQGLSSNRDEMLYNVDTDGCHQEACGAVRMGSYKLVWGSKALGYASKSGECSWIRDYYSLSPDPISPQLDGDGTSIVVSGLIQPMDFSVFPDNLDLDDCSCATQSCLFNLASDPCEYIDIQHEEPDIYEMLKAKLIEYYEEQVTPLSGLENEIAAADPAQFDGYWTPWLTLDDALTSLSKGLGYVITSQTVAGKIHVETGLTKKRRSFQPLELSVNVNTAQIKSAESRIIWYAVSVMILSILAIYGLLHCWNETSATDNRRNTSAVNGEKSGLLKSNEKSNYVEATPDQML